MADGAVPAAGEIEGPRAELVHPRAAGLRAGLRHAGHRPCHVPEVAGMAAVALSTMGSETHAGEISGGLKFIEQVEQHGGHAVFAIVVVTLSIQGAWSP